MQFIAPRYTHVPASTSLQRIGEATDVVAGGNSPILVYGIVASATSGTTTEIQFFEEDGSTIITRLRFNVPNGNTAFSLNKPFVARKGLKVTTPSGGSCTVFYSHRGI